MIAEVLTKMETLDNSYPIQAGDLVSIRILEDKRDAFKQKVSPAGEIQAPYLGLFKSTGLTPRKLAFKLKAQLEEKFFPTATVLVTVEKLVMTDGQPTGGCPKLEFVILYGAVAKAGHFDFPRNADVTISSLLHRAGGHTSKQKTPKIKIIRKTPQGYKCILVNTQAALNENRSDYDLFLRIDDVVIVE